MLDEIAPRVRPEHRPAVAEQVVLLEAALARHVPDLRRREFASRPDPQGIGGHSTPGLGPERALTPGT